MRAVPVVETRCELAEGPLWNPFDERLYWTDIDCRRLYRLDPATDKPEVVLDKLVIGGFTLQADGGLLLFGERGAIYCFRDGHLETLVEELADESDTRFNDCIADPAGRVYCGTLPGKTHLARLYRLDHDGVLSPVVRGVGLANGLGFSPDRRRLYFTDTVASTIFVFEYDEERGELLNRQPLLRVEDQGRPDGLTVDAEGCVWSARWGGGCVVRYTPDGREDRRVEVPTPNVTSVAFGGRDYRDLYITTAGGGEQSADQQAGALFCLRGQFTGKPEFLSRIRLSAES